MPEADEREYKPLDEDVDVFGMIEPFPFTSIGPYLNTRKLIRGNHQLWNFSKNEIQDNNLQGPWVFNLYESVLASLPISVLNWLLELIFPLSLDSSSLESAQQKILSFFAPFLTPLSLMILANTASWASLRKRDYTPYKGKKAKYAYLYLDGAYGLIPQILASLFSILYLELFLREVSDEWLIITVGALLLLSSL